MASEPGGEPGIVPDRDRVGPRPSGPPSEARHGRRERPSMVQFLDNRRLGPMWEFEQRYLTRDARGN
jgi:hypothetical protein